MAPALSTPAALTRRALLKQLAGAPLLLRAAPLRAALADGRPGAWSIGRPGAWSIEGAPGFTDVRYTPHYPVRSPLEDVLRLVTPGLDEFASEKDAAELEELLAVWAGQIRLGHAGAVAPLCAPELRWSPLAPARERRVRFGFGIDGVAYEFSQEPKTGVPVFVQAIEAWLGPRQRVEHAQFEITSIGPHSGAAPEITCAVRFSLVVAVDLRRREQRIGVWTMVWRRSGPAWQMTRFEATTESRASLNGAGFRDVTAQALGGAPSYTAQMLHGSDYWRTVLDAACGVDIYGNNGIAAGDFDNDGLDDLYVSQPAGLPNRLYRNRGDGTFEDVTERAGVGVLDNTACALFADLRNSGLQDLLVVTGNGPLLWLNQGDGTFSLKRDAFQFASPPAGAFTHAAIADVDGDGRLDIYFCLYSYYLGLDQYHYPAPYFDARNGPPNFLLHNRGDGTFVDRTAAAGLDAENDRYSFSCAWGHGLGGKGPDLYVVNDFGRNNLYRNNGDGTFRAVSSAAHVEDVGAGMSACWADTNNDGLPDLYAANMWSAAGQRVSAQAAFHAQSTPAVRTLYQRHARGNALYRNRGDGTFESAGMAAGVDVGRWAWGSDFWDFDHDGFADLYVTNGYISAPAEPRAAAPDLASFFWRQVVGKSSDDATPSLAYEHGWNALNELIRTDSAWNGSERNVLFANNGDGSFTDVSGALGMDFLEDGRSFALADLDGDGRLEVIVKNRNAPQLRILYNAMEQLGDSIAFRLRGTASNRDAIGATVTLTAGAPVQTKALEAGSGFLAQHTKQLFFGLGRGSATVAATIHWPSGLSQSFKDLPRNASVEIEEGRATFSARPFRATAKTYAQPSVQPGAQPSAGAPETLPVNTSTWLLDPLKAPVFTLPDAVGRPVTLAPVAGRGTLLHLFSSADADGARPLIALDRARGALQRAKLDVLALDLAAAAGRGAKLPGVSWPVLSADDETAGIYNLVFRYLFDRRANLRLPTSFLLDDAGMIVKVYQGALAPADVEADAHALPVPANDRTRRALPFAGTLHLGSFGRNDFTYGVAMFQHGYLNQASASFEQVIALRPNDADAHYNLGTLSLRRNDFAQARQQLTKTLALKPNYPEAWNNLGMMAAQQGQTGEAVNSFKQSLALRPAYTTALLNLGNLYRRERSFAEARTCLTQALSLAPDDPEANYSVGMLYAQQDAMQPSSEYLTRAIELRPDYAEARNNLGVLYVRAQRFQEAEQQFSSSIRLAPSFASSYFNLAQLYLVQNDKEKARATIDSLLKREPGNAAAKQALKAIDQTP